MLSTLTHLAGAGFCIVACMDELDVGFQREYPYRVVTSGLTDDEIEDFGDRLDADATKSFKVFCRDPSPIFLAESVEFCVKYSSVLRPMAGAVGKAGLDVLVDSVKNWLANRPEHEDRTVEIFGPDNEVVRIVNRQRDTNLEFITAMPRVTALLVLAEVQERREKHTDSTRFI